MGVTTPTAATLEQTGFWMVCKIDQIMLVFGVSWLGTIIPWQSKLWCLPRWCPSQRGIGNQHDKLSVRMRGNPKAPTASKAIKMSPLTFRAASGLCRTCDHFLGISNLFSFQNIQLDYCRQRLSTAWGTSGFTLRTKQIWAFHESASKNWSVYEQKRT